VRRSAIVKRLRRLRGRPCHVAAAAEASSRCSRARVRPRRRTGTGRAGLPTSCSYRPAEDHFAMAALRREIIKSLSGSRQGVADACFRRCLHPSLTVRVARDVSPDGTGMAAVREDWPTKSRVRRSLYAPLRFSCGGPRYGNSESKSLCGPTPSSLNFPFVMMARKGSTTSSASSRPLPG
jgi:hypothetical protein